jgi:hypothetical protein
MLPKTVNSFYSVLWSNSHFVVVECCLENRDITIDDGYIHHTSIIQYAPNVKMLLQGCDLIPFNCKDDFVEKGSGMYLDLWGTKSTWSLRGPLC